MTATGDGVDSSWVGQHVWAFTGLGGGYVEQAIAPVGEILALPADRSAVDAVTLGSSGVVAHFALAHARFAPGESVLVRGAADSIGIMTVQLAARGGASAVAVATSSAERGDRLRKLGAIQVLDRAGGDAPMGYDVIIDVVAGAGMPAFFDRLNPNGRMVVVGVVGGYPPATSGCGCSRVPEVDVVRDLQLGHRAHGRSAGGADRAVRGGGSWGAADGGARDAAVGAGRAGSPEDGSRRRVRPDRARALGMSRP